MLRDHGQSSKYFHDIEGYNGRLDAIQAGILTVKLRRLAEWNERRRTAARGYRVLLAGSDRVVLPHVPQWSRPVFHLYVVRVADRAALQRELAEAGVGTGVHYPIPLHLSRAYQGLGFRQGQFPVAEQACAQVLSLPMYPDLSVEYQRRVADAIQLASGVTASRAVN
jgi:dTDP-4-amino-4,6-dideoxygalactose transaminase